MRDINAILADCEVREQAARQVLADDSPEGLPEPWRFEDGCVVAPDDPACPRGYDPRRIVAGDGRYVRPVVGAHIVVNSPAAVLQACADVREMADMLKAAGEARAILKRGDVHDAGCGLVGASLGSAGGYVIMKPCTCGTHERLNKAHETLNALTAFAGEDAK